MYLTSSSIPVAACVLSVVSLLRDTNVNLSENIARAEEFRNWLHASANDIEVPNTDRKRAAFAILQQSLDCCDAILVLLNAGLPGPALALGRPLFESYSRAYWLMHGASGEQIADFMNGDGPNFRQLRNDIRAKALEGGPWLDAMYTSNIKGFHDLTHGGAHHVRLRTDGDAIEPNYPESVLIQLVHLVNEVRVRCGFELITELNSEKAMEDLAIWARAVRDIDPPMPDLHGANPESQ